MTLVSSKEFLDIQANIECGFTLKRVHDMLKAYSYVCYLVIVVIFMGNGGAKLFYQGKPQRALEATCITSQWTYFKN